MFTSAHISLAKANHPLTPKLKGVGEVGLHQATEEKRDCSQAGLMAIASITTGLSRLPGEGLSQYISEGKGKKCDNWKEETFVIISRLFFSPIST